MLKYIFSFKFILYAYYIFSSELFFNDLPKNVYINKSTECFSKKKILHIHTYCFYFFKFIKFKNEILKNIIFNQSNCFII